MKSTLIATVPAFVVILVLAFGFVTFHVMIEEGGSYRWCRVQLP